jgi:hypothetical protein
VSDSELAVALQELLDQIDTFEHITFTRDDAQYKSAAAWAYLVERAKKSLRDYKDDRP